MLHTMWCKCYLITFLAIFMQVKKFILKIQVLWDASLGKLFLLCQKITTPTYLPSHSLKWLLDPDDEDNIILQNIRSYLPNDTSYPIRLGIFSNKPVLSLKSHKLHISNKTHTHTHTHTHISENVNTIKALYSKTTCNAQFISLTTKSNCWCSNIALFPTTCCANSVQRASLAAFDFNARRTAGNVFRASDILFSKIQLIQLRNTLK